MSKRTRILAAAMSAMLMTTALVGCKSDEEKGSNSKDKLVVWSHLKTPEVEAIRDLAEKWAEDKDVSVQVVEDKGEMQQAITALQSSKGPDLYFGLSHDNLGTYQKAGVLDEVPADYGVSEDEYNSQALVDAVTINGKQYAIPVAMECVALFYNKDKVEAPATMEEIDTSKFMFNATDFYLAYGFLSAGGGYVFANNDGTLDPTDVGLGDDAIDGYKYIKTLADAGLITADMTDDIAKTKFMEGETNYYISGPWNIADCSGAVNLGIVPLPTLSGNDMKPFLGVQAAFVSSKSKKKDLAWDLCEYLQKESAEVLITEGNRLPALATAMESEAFKSNEFLASFVEASEVAVPMPNIPAAQAMWSPGADALKAILAGSMTPEEAAKQVKEQIDAAVPSYIEE